MSSKVLAFDFGASSGRAIIGEIVDGKLVYKEIHRFFNGGVDMNGKLCWEFDRLWNEVKEGIKKARDLGGFDAIGIDTWGVDYGFISADGKLLAQPYNYRDNRTEKAFDEVLKKVDATTLYEHTGIQLMRINTLFQMYASKCEGGAYDEAKTMLFMPDLFAYMLTGNMACEYTIASTSEMINPVTGEWDYELLNLLGIRTDILPEIIDSGKIYGNIKQELCDELAIKSVPVVAVCGHDTASAVVAVPAISDDFCYISCGTWSLMGIELDKPLLNEMSAKLNFTNEGGYGRTIRFLKNIMGLWIIQECRRNWNENGGNLGFGDIMQEALKAESVAYINPDDSDFEKPCNMPEMIRAYCKKTGQRVPEGIGEIARCVYESLALKYRYTVESLEKLSGKKYDSINIIGGGGQNTMLCTLTADICERKVVAGPFEATAIGNMAVQLMALGEVKDLKDARRLVADSENVKVFEPTGNTKYDYAKFLSLVE